MFPRENIRKNNPVIDPSSPIPFSNPNLVEKGLNGDHCVTGEKNPGEVILVRSVYSFDYYYVNVGRKSRVFCIFVTVPRLEQRDLYRSAFQTWFDIHDDAMGEELEKNFGGWGWSKSFVDFSFKRGRRNFPTIRRCLWEKKIKWKLSKGM